MTMQLVATPASSIPTQPNVEEIVRYNLEFLQPNLDCHSRQTKSSLDSQMFDQPGMPERMREAGPAAIYKFLKVSRSGFLQSSFLDFESDWVSSQVSPHQSVDPTGNSGVIYKAWKDDYTVFRLSNNISEAALRGLTQFLNHLGGSEGLIFCRRFTPAESRELEALHCCAKNYIKSVTGFADYDATRIGDDSTAQVALRVCREILRVEIPPNACLSLLARGTHAYPRFQLNPLVEPFEGEILVAKLPNFQLVKVIATTPQCITVQEITCREKVTIPLSRAVQILRRPPPAR